MASIPTHITVTASIEQATAQHPATAQYPAYFRVIKSEGMDDLDELLLYGFIGQASYDDDDEDDITAASVVKAIRECDKKRRPFRIRINSPGGSVFHGDAIVTAIRECRSEVHTYIDGMAASMAADIWMAGDKRHMASNSKLMIHRTSTFAFGNAQDLREAADALDKFDEAAINTFVELTSMGKDEAIERFYNYKDNWLTAADALMYGLIESIDTYEAKMPDESRTYRQLLTEAMRGTTSTEPTQTPEPEQQENWRQAYIDKLGRLITLTN
jgi:ATP-dependent Clp endopeptidase proteolytic subunit ClpP